MHRKLACPLRAAGQGIQTKCSLNNLLPPHKNKEPGAYRQTPAPPLLRPPAPLLPRSLAPPLLFLRSAQDFGSPAP